MYKTSPTFFLCTFLDLVLNFAFVRYQHCSCFGQFAKFRYTLQKYIFSVLDYSKQNTSYQLTVAPCIFLNLLAEYCMIKEIVQVIKTCVH